MAGGTEGVEEQVSRDPRKVAFELVGKGEWIGGQIFGTKAMSRGQCGLEQGAYIRACVCVCVRAHISYSSLERRMVQPGGCSIKSLLLARNWSLPWPARRA